MTVISKIQHGFPDSNANSDSESLHLGSTTASETSSLHNEPLRTRLLPAPYRPVQFRFDEAPTFHKHCGKRKLRRYQNYAVLQTLSEEENEDAVILFEPMASPLSRLLQNPVALARWNDFIEKPEEEQKKMCKFEIAKKYERCGCSKAQPFNRISSKIRRTLKIRKNLSMEIVKTCEEDVINFFNRSPENEYVKYPHTSFERLLTHAVAQYHCLHSIGEWENEKRKVIIHNLQSNWTPTQRFLYEFISESRAQ